MVHAFLQIIGFCSEFLSMQSAESRIEATNLAQQFGLVQHCRLVLAVMRCAIIRHVLAIAMPFP
ncbi:MAG: hypothetical protein K8S22_10645, partial [Betaproteobacteria bacterium]|nr:hypothetical protein [Betaproteobacteria bacterium]